MPSTMAWQICAPPPQTGTFIPRAAFPETDIGPLRIQMSLLQQTDGVRWIIRTNYRHDGTGARMTTRHIWGGDIGPGPGGPPTTPRPPAIPAQSLPPANRGLDHQPPDNPSAVQLRACVPTPNVPWFFIDSWGPGVAARQAPFGYLSTLWTAFFDPRTVRVLEFIQAPSHPLIPAGDSLAKFTP